MNERTDRHIPTLPVPILIARGSNQCTRNRSIFLASSPCVYIAKFDSRLYSFGRMYNNLAASFTTVVLKAIDDGDFKPAVGEWSDVSGASSITILVQVWRRS